MIGSTEWGPAPTERSGSVFCEYLPVDGSRDDHMTRLCLVVALVAAAGSSAHAQERAAPAEEADRLYTNRTDLPSIRRAIEIWRTALKTDPGNFDASWKIARGDYWLGGHA